MISTAIRSASVARANLSSCCRYLRQGWNMYEASEVCIDSFPADRGPDHHYRTAPIGALSTHFQGGFYHDGRFADLSAVVDHYDKCMNLGLDPGEKNDLVQYLLSLKF